MKATVPRIVLASLLAATLPLLSATPTPDDQYMAHRDNEPKPTDLFRMQISTMRARIGLALGKLQALQQEQADLPTVFKDYSDEVTEVGKLAKQIARQAEVMKKEDMAFFRIWEEQVAKIQDAELQKLAQGRYDRRMKSYRKMVTLMEEARVEFVPFLASLQDIQKLLESDLNPKSVKSGQKFMKAAKLKGMDLENDLYDILMEERRVSAEMGHYQ